MISINNAKKTYFLGGEKIKALDDVSMKITKGDFVAIIGPSGSGKSTLLHVIGGLDSLDRGSIEVDGEDIGSMKDKKLANYRNEVIGFVFQSFNLQNKYSALENVELPLVFSGMKKKDRTKKAKGALEKVGLSDRMMHKPTELSGGQQQRVCIARAIVTDPKIILADEPTGNLDSKSGSKIVSILKGLNERTNVTVVVVTHDDRIAQSADRILRILDGKIVEDVRNGKKHIIKEHTD